MTTLGFAIADLMIGYAMWRYELFKLTPLTAADRIIATMSDALFLVDNDGIIRTSNNAADNLLGTVQGWLTGKLFTNLFCDPAVGLNIVESLPALQTIRDMEVSMKQASGREVPVSLSATTLSDDRGELQGMIFIGRDVTRRKMILDELRRAHDELEVRVKERTAELDEEKELSPSRFVRSETVWLQRILQGGWS